MDGLADIYPCVTTTLTRYMAWEPAQDFATEEKIRQEWPTKGAQHTDRHFVLRHKQDQRFIGLIGVNRMQTSPPNLDDGFGKIVTIKVLPKKPCLKYYNGLLVIYPLNISYIQLQPKISQVENWLNFEVEQLVMHKTEKKYQAVIYHIPPYQAQYN